MTKGERIKNRRLELDLSQVDLAKTIHVSKQTLYKYEQDIITNIPSDKIEALAKALQVEPFYIMGWNDEKPAVTLRPDESSLLSDYNRLNPLGRDEASKRVKELTRISEYVKKENSGSLSQVG